MHLHDNMTCACTCACACTCVYMHMCLVRIKQACAFRFSRQDVSFCTRQLDPPPHTPLPLPHQTSEASGTAQLDALHPAPHTKRPKRSPPCSWSRGLS